MFAKNLGNTILVGGTVDSCFSKHIPSITRASFMSDFSILATARVLLHERMKDIEGAKLLFDITGCSYGGGRLAMNSRSHNFGNIVGSIESNTLRIVSINSVDADSRAATFKYFDDNFLEFAPNFSRAENGEKYLAAKVHLNTRIYIDKDLKTTIVIVDYMSLRTYHYIQSILPFLLQWFFVKKPANDEDVAFLTTLTVRDPSDYEAALQNFYNKLDLRSVLIESVLSDFERASRESELSDINNEVRQLERSVSDYRSSMQNAICRLDNAFTRKRGLEAIIAQGFKDSEVMEFFRMNKGLMPVSAGDRKLSFTVRSYLDVFDVDVFEAFVNNKKSTIYNEDQSNVGIDKVSDRVMLLKAIFSDEPAVRVRMKAYFEIDLRGYVNTERGYRFPADMNDCLPNTHLDRHACLGRYEGYINDLLAGHDIIAAIAQCITATKSLNIGEWQTFEPFLDALFNCTYPIIELPDGSNITPQEAVRWLKENEKKEEE